MAFVSHVRKVNVIWLWKDLFPQPAWPKLSRLTSSHVLLCPPSVLATSDICLLFFLALCLMWSILQLTDISTDPVTHRKMWECKHALSFLFSFRSFFEEKDKVIFQFHLVALALSIFQSPSNPLQPICCNGSWYKAWTSLSESSFCLFPIFSSLKACPTQIDSLLWGWRESQLI